MDSIKHRPKIPNSFALSNGLNIPAIGFGTFDPNHPDGAYAATKHALEAGYRHLDCASLYKNEEHVGRAIKEWLSENPHMKRADLFITTKVWNHLHHPDDVHWSLEQSLHRLGMDWVDLFLLHYPIATVKQDQYTEKKNAQGKYMVDKHLTDNFEPTWRAMESLVHAGKTKSIGVSNYSIRRLAKLLEKASIPPAVNQIEIHPFFPNTKLVEYCQTQKILPQAYSPLGSQSSSRPAHGTLLDSQELKDIAAKADTTLGQLLLSWGAQRGYCVLPKSWRKERIYSNFKLHTLSQDILDDVSKVAEHKWDRFVDISGSHDCGYKYFWDDVGDR